MQREGGENMQEMVWLALFILLLIIEIATMGLTTIWFAGGALAAFIAGLLGCGLAVQIILFLVVSILLFVFTRPVAVKYFNKDRQKTNADRLVGQEALVTEAIDTLQAQGTVVVNGQEWSAKTNETDGKIAKGSVVVIDEIQGVKLVVREKED